MTKWTWRPSEQAAIYQAIQAPDRNSLFTMPTCEEQFQLFTAVLSSLINDLLPIKIVKRNENDKFHQLIGLCQYHFHSGNSMMFKLLSQENRRCQHSTAVKWITSTLTTGGKK